MSEKKQFSVTAEVATALSELIVKSNIRRLSKGLRNLVIEQYMLMGNDRPYWFLVLLEDLMPLFIFFDETEAELIQYYEYLYPDEEYPFE
ncbi:hypothetical protein [Chitinophaga eiseniae]|uniref:Uncharacterized protein n=1 Tax=Chitinophaga eiseniae TaxID=634771 RepID=A0A847SPR5_9BACT|nr:hypothetical protein [Chitinophaga eiseniae]NLR82274.1 hypothetical protein [Chitinophaga eiseniae]